MSDDEILYYNKRRLRELHKIRARSGINTLPEVTMEIEELEAEIARLEEAAARAGLPSPPAPDFVHPYPIQSGFTGRVAERTMLSAWLGSGAQPVLALIGIGGMGKSALSWAWLQRDVLGLPLPGASPDAPAAADSCRLPENARPTGVLWWSFYESAASFENFLDEAINYASGRHTNSRDIASTYDKVRVLLGMLQSQRLLLVLDGFERELRAYASLGAAYQGDEVEREAQGEHRACVSPHAARFLRDAATLPLASRMLITSRLFPRELDDLAGCRREDLRTIHPDDAVAFFHGQGIRGTRAEIQAACAPYGYHALALRLLAGVVKKNRRTPGDIKVAAQYPILPELKGQAQHHILQVAYDQLDQPKRIILGSLAAFLRSPKSYDELLIMNDNTDVNLFDKALDELEERGFLFFDRELIRYDMHPVVQTYAYSQLEDKVAVHNRLYGYFATFPPLDFEQVQSLEQLIPTIELYQNSIFAGQYDHAIDLFRSRLAYALYFRLGNYQICIELLSAIFLKGEAFPPELTLKHSQAWVMNMLGLAYSLAGQPRRAVPLLIASNTIDSELENKVGLAVGLGNLATMAQIILGDILAAEENLRHCIELSRETEDSFQEAVGHHGLGWLLIYKGMFNDAEVELILAQDNFDKNQGTNFVAIIRCYRALRFLFMNMPEAALEMARKALQLADVWRVERDIIQAEWVLSVALLAVVERSEDKQNILTETEIHLSEALTRCRKINLVDHEPDILLAWARWHQLTGNAAQAREDANEALQIAERCEYRLKQADAHLFLARLDMAENQRAAARQHAEKARERAWCDGPPHSYKPALDAAERLLGELGSGERISG